MGDRPQSELHYTALAGRNIALRSLDSDVPDLRLGSALAIDQLRKTGGQDAAARNFIASNLLLPLCIQVNLVDQHGLATSGAGIDVSMQRFHKDIAAVIGRDARAVHIDVS